MSIWSMLLLIYLQFKFYEIKIMDSTIEFINGNLL